MRRAFLTISFIATTLLLNAQTKTLDKNGFHTFILQSFDDIFSNWKTEAIKQYYADGFLILEDGLLWNKDSLMTYLNRRIESGRKIER